MLRYLVVLSRPRFWLYLAGPVLVGAAYGASTLDALLSPTVGLLVGYFLLPANVYLYGVNDIFDRDTDQYNPKKGGREARYRDQWPVTVAVLGSGLLLVPVAATLPRASWPALAGWALLATAYSAPPLRFKARPLFDSLSNGLYILPGLATFTALAGSQPPLAAVFGGWLWAMAMHTFSAIPDIEPDRAADLRTTATWLGERGAVRYCGLLWTGAALSFGLLDWRLGAVLAVYPILLWGIRRAGISIDRAYWWYPAVNTLVGGLLTVGGLSSFVYG
ncbi:UbiA prenyltransferase [Halodesulfurarchaeum formicicum]|uniref:UbiA prenyltransferase n=1 Tax=Halodesulfurarchaeum formicicum TaxID=1873524 RepID=A0A1D8S2C9_9EURY|nr:prenyltransferase [Halodesulfurarchaeum formicicum]AOW79522.1 UbiA prenyltransferase [Halodesulfurarchaeum formicicum]APE94774.1 UbiA prenyltransferase [Halodesulfurarchaeum formicicum]